VSTVHERGWSTLADGALLAAAEQDGFAVFVTTDQQRKDQRQLAGRRLALLVRGTTSWPRIEPHAEAIRQLIADLVAGAYRESPLLRPPSSNERPARVAVHRRRPTDKRPGIVPAGRPAAGGVTRRYTQPDRPAHAAVRAPRPLGLRGWGRLSSPDRTPRAR